MKSQATLYTLHELPVMVSRDYYEFSEIPPIRTFDGNFLAPLDRTVIIHRVPVHHVHTVKRGGVTQDDYIIIAPELHHILNLPYEAIICEAYQKLGDAQLRSGELWDTIQKFREMPWYRRVWAALKGGLK